MTVISFCFDPNLLSLPRAGRASAPLSTVGVLLSTGREGEVALESRSTATVRFSISAARGSAPILAFVTVVGERRRRLLSCEVKSAMSSSASSAQN